MKLKTGNTKNYDHYHDEFSKKYKRNGFKMKKKRKQGMKNPPFYRLVNGKLKHTHTHTPIQK